MAQRSRDNDDKIAQFQAVTGLQDSALCAQILQHFGWDLDQAVSSMADGGLSPEDTSTSSAAGSLEQNGDDMHHSWYSNLGFSDGNLARNQQMAIQPHQAGPGLIWRVASLPFSVARGGFSVMSGAFGLGMWIAGGILTHSLGALGLAGQQRESQRDGEGTLLPMTPGATEALEFIRSFEREYGEHHLAFQISSFTDALRRAKDEFKFLFVYLHSPDHENTPRFVESTLSSDAVVQFVNENFVVWGGSIRSSEGFRMSNSLKASTFPFCAVVMASNNQRIVLLQQIEGPKTSAEVISALQKVLDEHGAALVAARIEEEERHMNRRLRDEQDAAYQAALRADQERERQLKEEADRLAFEAAEAERKKREEEEAAAKAAQEAAERQAAIEKRRQEKAMALGPEPEKGPDVTEVLIRFPNGERGGRRFQSTATLSSVYDYVDSLPGFGVSKYKLVSNFPRVVYGADKMGVSLKDAGLHPRASLYIQIEDDE